MKMTVEIPEDLVADLMRAKDFRTKRAAIEFALSEAVRRVRLRRFMEEGLGMTSGEMIADAVDNPSDALAVMDGDPEEADRMCAVLNRMREVMGVGGNAPHSKERA